MNMNTLMDIEVYPPSGLTARQQGQRHRRQREGLQRNGLNGATDGPAGLQTPPPDLPHHDLGPRDIVCPECGALHWKGEMLKSSTLRSPRFGMCCSEGDKILSRIMDPSEPLCRPLTYAEPDAIQFRKNIRRYNAAFAFTSLGMKLDDRLKGDGLRPFQIHGEIHHQFGTLEPEPGQSPVYAQHYLYDGDEATAHRFERNPNLD
jgi:hypothetical protein